MADELLKKMTAVANDRGLLKRGKMKIRHAPVALCLLTLAAACAGSSPTKPTTPDPVTPPSSSIQKAINTVISSFTTAMNKTRSGKTFTFDALRGGDGFLPGAQSITTQCNKAGTSCSSMFNENYNETIPCTNGGSTSVAQTLTGVIQSSANSTSGTLNLATRQTFSSCAEGNWVTNTASSIGTNGSIFVTTNHTRINVTMSGGFTVSNAPGTPAGQAVCAFNGVILQWDDITGNWANSGSVDCLPGGSFRFN
jgi:hypothetical protein